LWGRGDGVRTHTHQSADLVIEMINSGKERQIPFEIYTVRKADDDFMFYVGM
jgi:hypothetical protein